MSDIDDDLIKSLNEATEIKKPNINDAISKVNSTFFESEDVQLPEIKTEEATPEAKPNLEPAKKVSKQDAKLSGETAAAGIDFVTSIVAEAIVAIKSNNKFTGDERKQYNDLIRDADKSKLTEQGLFIREKGDRIIREKNRKLKEIEPSEKARQRMEAAFTKYYEITGKELSPVTLVVAAIAENVIHTISKAAID